MGKIHFVPFKFEPFLVNPLIVHELYFAPSYMTRDNPFNWHVIIGRG